MYPMSLDFSNPYGSSETDDSSGVNPFSMLRRKSIFQQPTTPEDNTKRFLSQVNPAPKADFSPSPSSFTSGQDEGGKYYDALERIRRNKGPALTAYQAALADQPTHENTEPSFGRKLVGTLAGIAGGFAGGPKAGIETAENITDSPYREAMSDYQARIKNLGQSAQMEQDDTEAQLKSLAAARALGLKYDEFALKKAEDDRNFNLNTRKVNLEQGKNESDAAYHARLAATGEANAATNAAGQKATAANQVGVLGVRQREAATGESNARTNAGRLAQETKYQDATIDVRKKRVEQLGKAGKTTTPVQQAYAEDNALRELASDPNFNKFVIPNKDKGTYDLAVDDGSLMYKEFKRRYKALVTSAIKSSSPFDDEADSSGDDLGDITIGKPKGR